MSVGKQKQSWKVISKEELEESCKDDAYYKELMTKMAECHREIVDVINLRLADAKREVQSAYHSKQRMIARIMGYNQRLQMHRNHIKQRLIWKKLKETRHQIGI